MAQTDSQNGRLLRLFTLLCLGSVPLVQFVLVGLVSADYQICFGSEGGWLKPRDLRYLLPLVAQSLYSLEALLVLLAYTLPILPVLIYVALPTALSLRIKAVLVAIYLVLTIAPFLGPPSAFHDCDRKGVDMLGILPLTLSIAATTGFLILVLIASAFRYTQKKLS